MALRKEHLRNRIVDDLRRRNENWQQLDELQITEAQRKRAEGERLTAEEERIIQEDIRITNEAERIQNEIERGVSFEELITPELVEERVDERITDIHEDFFEHQSDYKIHIYQGEEPPAQPKDGALWADTLGGEYIEGGGGQLLEDISDTINYLEEVLSRLEADFDELPIPEKTISSPFEPDMNIGDEWHKEL